MTRLVTALAALGLTLGAWMGGADARLGSESAPGLAADTIVAADLDLERVGGLLGRRVWIRGDLVRLGRQEIDRDFAVADRSGIAQLQFTETVIENPLLLEALLRADAVEVSGLVLTDPVPGGRSEARIVVGSAGDVVLRNALPYRLIAYLLGVIAMILALAALVVRQRHAERRAADLAAFTRELDRRDAILRAVSYAGEQFLRSDSWEEILPEALERLGRAAEVTRTSLHLATSDGRGSGLRVAGEWIHPRVAERLGARAPADLETGAARLPRWREAMFRHEAVAGSMADIPEPERRFFEERGMRSVLSIPVVVSGELAGLFALIDHETDRTWPESEREALLMAARMVTAALERRQTELALAEMEDRFRQLAEHVREVFFTIDVRTNEVLYLSPAYEEIWGRPRAGANSTDHAFTDAILPEDRHLLSGDIGASRSGQGPSERTFEYRIRRPDGSIRWIRTRRFQIPDAEGRPYRVTGICTDITEQKQLEEDLRRANRVEAMGHLAAGIAHEINTPVQYIGGNLEFLDECFQDLRLALEAYRTLLDGALRGDLASDRVAEIASIIERTDIGYIYEEAPKASSQALDGVRRVTEIVRAMKEFSHPGSGTRVMTDLNRAVLSTATVARSEWKYVAELSTDLDPALPLVPCLAGEVNQAILNLVVNAAHAIADRQASENLREFGLITIATRSTGEFVEIRVTDTGTGIPEEIRPRIFDPFFTTKEVGRGTGQGLTFVHSIVVDQHGGSVSFETEPGRGTTFILRFPTGASAPDFSQAA